MPKTQKEMLTTYVEPELGKRLRHYLAVDRALTQTGVLRTALVEYLDRVAPVPAN
jgi:hypothetical protein